MRPPKLTQANKDWIHSVVLARRAIPSNKQIAAHLGVCKQLVDQVSAAVPRGTNGVNVTPYYDVRG